MTDAPDDKPTPRDLMAFLDGELDAAEQMRIVRQVAGDPQLVEQLERQRQFKQAIGLSFESATPPVPESLRTAVRQIADEHASPLSAAPQTPRTPQTPRHSSLSQPPRAVIGWVGRWVPAAVAALLLFSTWVVVQNQGDEVALPGSERVIPVAQLDRFESRHWRCSRQIDQLRQTSQTLQVADPDQLPQTVSQLVGQPCDAQFDLTAHGYEFWKMGDCRIPGEDSAHLIYRSADRDAALSLWLVADRGQLADVEEGRTCLATGENAAHPMVVWRRGGLVYYLMGDLPAEDIDQAAHAIQRIAMR